MPKGLQPEHATLPSAAANAKAAGARRALEKGPAKVDYDARKAAAKAEAQKAAAVAAKQSKGKPDADASKS